MASEKYHAAVVFGSGPGCGRNVAALFAEHGFQKVVLLSRNAERLIEDAEFVRAARDGTEVHTIPVDLGDIDATKEALQKVEQTLGDTALEFVLFNAARLGRSDMFSFTPQQLDGDLKIAIVGLYTVAQWAMPKLVNASTSTTCTPSFIATSGMLAKDPAPAMFSLAACKAGQHNLMHSLHKEFEPKGVHCGLLVIGGKVSDEAKVTNARNCAEEIWKMFSAQKGEGGHEVVLIDPAYAEHVKNREK